MTHHTSQDTTTAVQNQKGPVVVLDLTFETMFSKLSLLSTAKQMRNTCAPSYDNGLMCA